MKAKASKDAAKREKILARLKTLKQNKVNALRIKKDYMSANLWEFYRPYMWQDSMPDRIRRKHVVLAPAPNGIGKTVAMVCILASWLEGYEAWNEVDEFYPNAVKVDGKYFKASSLGKKPPVDIRLTGEDWNHQLGRVVVKAIKEWFPNENYTVEKKGRSVECFWTHKKNGSTLELMSHTQDVDLFEGWRGDGWAADEPPPYDIFKPMARGLAEKKGKMLMFTTPLKQAWMLDKLIRNNRTDVEVVKDLILYDNEGSYGNDNRILDELGLSGKVTKYWRKADGEKKEFFDLILYVDDNGVAAEKFLRDRSGDVVGLDSKMLNLIFLRKARDTAIEEKPSRFFGVFKQLMGLVIKNFDRVKHVVPTPEKGIPTNWIVTVMVDIHYSKPNAISFFACDEHDLHYAIDEYWVNGSPQEMADIIIRKKRIDGWNIENVFIDPLSKGDNFMKNLMPDSESTFNLMDERLADEGIYLQVASKDKGSGVRNIREWLEGPNRIPTLYFFDSLQSVESNTRGIVYDIQRVSFDDKGNIEKIDDDFFENLYRYTLTGTKYIESGGSLAMSGPENSSSQGWMG